MRGADGATLMDRVLAAERSALLNGNIAALAGLAEEKERALAALVAEPAGVMHLGSIRARAEANAMLIEAALRGVRTARERLETARNGGVNLSTYDAQGRTASVPNNRRGLERRA